MMWVHPRQSMRQILETKVNRGLYCLSWIYGFQFSLRLCQELSLGAYLNAWLIVAIAAIAALPLGWIAFNISAFVFNFTGKLIKGKGDHKQIRAAVAWGNVPIIISCLIWIVMTAVFGNYLFFEGFYEVPFSGGEGILLTVNFAVMLIFGIWATIIFLHALGQAQGFSFWMALLNLVLASIVFVVVGWGISAIINLF
ncbi:MAG: YIP1 family protein [Simkaniaceae bacterium]|nr:YIP1 family protein [Simkaniaceae bacterium]